MNKRFCVIGMIVGIITVLIGLYVAFGYKASFNGTYTDSASFGADFYTYIYEATSDASYNVAALGNLVSKALSFIVRSLGFLLMSIGGAITCFFGYKMDCIKKDTKPVLNLPDFSEPVKPEEPKEDEWIVPAPEEETAVEETESKDE